MLEAVNEGNSVQSEIHIIVNIEINIRVNFSTYIDMTQTVNKDKAFFSSIDQFRMVTNQC